MKTFIQDRLIEYTTVGVCRPVKKIKVKTFSFVTEVAKVHVKDQVVPIKAQSEFSTQRSFLLPFGSTTLVADKNDRGFVEEKQNSLVA